MPRELRKIFFNAVDLTHAIDMYRNEKPQFLPLGKIFHVAVELDHLLVRIEMKYVDNTHHLDYKIDYDKLVDVLIALCLERRIPLPSAGQKTTYAEEDEVVLEIVLAEDAFSVGNKSTEWARLRGVNAGAG